MKLFKRNFLIFLLLIIILGTYSCSSDRRVRFKNLYDHKVCEVSIADHEWEDVETNEVTSYVTIQASVPKVKIKYFTSTKMIIATYEVELPIKGMFDANHPDSTIVFRGENDIVVENDSK